MSRETSARRDHGRTLGRIARTGAAVILLAVAATVFARAATDDGRVDQAVRNGWSRYAIGLWGDLPYSPLQETTGVPNLIDDLNAQRLAFSVHDGDLKQGSNSPCDAALYDRSLAYFNALEAPAIFTPGDNDWTDCDRPPTVGSLPSIGWTMSARYFSAPRIRSVGISCRRTFRWSRSVSAWQGLSPV